MSLTHPFAPAQLLGYVALVLGITAFLQRSDQRLRLFNATQGLFYSMHFFLLGNLPACSSSALSSARSFISLRSRSRWWVLLFCALLLGIGSQVVTNLLGWLPIAASCAATVAVFLLYGIALRLVLLGCTFFWLTNNILCGSIGGTILETIIASVNGFTILRLVAARRRPVAEMPVAVKPPNCQA